MDHLNSTFWTELTKARRARMPLYTGLGFLLAPLACVFLMFIYKNPEFARQSGIISAKANLMAGVADWPTYLSMLAQATAIGGIFLFSLVCSWVIGREWVDGTLKDLLALPVSRTSIVLAKFLVIVLWSGALVVELIVTGLLGGVLIGLPGASAAVISGGLATLVGTAGLVIATVLPFALFASIGRGYLLPIALAMVTVMLANIAVLIGYGAYFPWAVPALFSGAGEEAASLGAGSYLLVLATAAAGIAATAGWWQSADQHR